ncbi:Rqc2 family fibronectin-binding protein [Lapidilactobacillus luobeiensis]|uniref:Rqc2 family fibronectin-binding protein n=1 Tax=Lapidilactobacillus luobeiensis TaxID=2950371 RepID=UPI0021C4554F|nr:NFACT family protein [Lapidilactobacillus luobeiensis]
MSFDGIFLHAMTAELTDELVGGRVVKLQQPYPQDVIVVVRNQRQNFPLLLSVNPTLARAQITRIPYANPKTPPNFVMTLRKYLENATVVGVEQVANDRILRLRLRSRNELGDQEDLLLIAEIMGRHSNILLVDSATGRIIDLIKHVSPDQNRFRLLMPGAQYVQPELQNGFDPFGKSALTSADWERLLLALRDLKTKPEQVWQRTFQGLGKDSAAELALQTKRCLDVASLQTTTLDFWQHFSQQQATIGRFNGQLQFSAVPYQVMTEQQSDFADLSVMLDQFYGQKAETDRKHQLASNMLQRLSTVIKRNRKKVKKLQQTLDHAENADIDRIKGEILTTYLNQVPEHAKSVTLPNYYEEGQPLVIKLAPELSPSKNAQKYFTRYQKAKTALVVVKQQLEETQTELDYLLGVEAQVGVGDPKDLADIQYELEQQGVLRPNQKRKKQRVKVNPAERFYASDGTEILVGKNNLQNDQLTLKTAKKTDLWLHTKNIPGSHVIITDPAPSEATIKEAAMLAAYFSKARQSSQVPVDYVPVKAIKKPNGAKPGFVIYTGQHTLYVTPELELVTRLRQKPIAPVKS